MRIFGKSRLLAACLVTSLSALALPAFAQSAPPPAAPAQPDRQRPPFDDRIDGRLAFLRAELKITPAQEPLWQAVEAVLRAQSQAREQAVNSMRAEGRGERPNTIERLTRAEEMANQRARDIAALRAAVTPLYAAFTDEQKATADHLLARFGGPGRGHGHHGRHGRRHG
ncbi:MAG TPA: Spy/CpxP family protein refolding chaperone [Alphaproteobacteria bacterium]|nr:Spy/CpxP family protein refolding chaperone [Alphaproteobacteria bacterium]